MASTPKKLIWQATSCSNFWTNHSNYPPLPSAPANHAEIAPSKYFQSNVNYDSSFPTISFRNTNFDKSNFKFKCHPSCAPPPPPHTPIETRQTVIECRYMSADDSFSICNYSTEMTDVTQFETCYFRGSPVHLVAATFAAR